jgi:hypothetical protein
VIVITDKTLRAAGIGFREAVGLLEPPEGELVVHVTQELDDISLPVVVGLKPEDDFGGDTLRHSYRASAPVEDTVPTKEPTQAQSIYTRSSLPATAEEIDAACAALQRRHDTLAVSAATLGLKDGTYGRPWWRSGSERLP